MSRASRPTSGLFKGLLAAAMIGGTALGASAQTSARVKYPQRETLEKLMRPIEIDFDNQRMEDVMSFVRDLSGAEIEVLFIDDRTGLGLDPDEEVTVTIKRGTVLGLIEKVLERAGRDLSEGENYTWQLTEYGTFEIGPKELLNRRRRLEIYDIKDLLIEVPDFINAPDFDLQQVLAAASQGGGGGGAQSPFQDDNEDIERIPLEERVENLIDIITQIVETEQWLRNGGEAATIRYFQGSLLVNAPDYVHRQLNGYPYWPSRQTRSTTRNGRKYVSLTGNPTNTMTRIAPTSGPGSTATGAGKGP